MSNMENLPKGIKLSIDPARISLQVQAQDHGGVCIVQANFESKTKGGIIIPDSHKKPAGRFLVHSVGPTERGHLKVIESGQTVYVHGWARPELWFTWRGDMYAVIKLEDIEAIVCDGGSLRPIGERLVVKPTFDQEKTAGGLYIPETVMERPQIGTVMVPGPGIHDADGTWIEVKPKVGQEVLYGRYCGATIQIGTEELLIIHQDDMLGVIIQRGAEHGNEGQAGDAGCTGGRCFPVGADA
jgi:chaperonin GroES